MCCKRSLATGLPHSDHVRIEVVDTFSILGLRSRLKAGVCLTYMQVKVNVDVSLGRNEVAESVVVWGQ